MSRTIFGYDVFGRGPYTAFGQTYDGVTTGPAPAGLASYGPPCAVPQPYDPQQAAMLAAAIASRGSAIVTDCPPTRAREQYLGVQEGPLPAGATASFIATPAQVFKPHRLVIPSDIGGAILVRNITVGNMPQLINAAGAGSLPGRMFSEFSTDELVNFDTAQISQQITLQVTNFSSSDILLFSAGYKGIAVM